MPTTAPRRTLRRALLRHAALTGIALILVAVVMMLGIWRYADAEAHREAERVAASVAETVIVPLSRYDYATAGADHRDAVMGTLEPFLTSGMVYRFKIWRLDGDQAEVVLSDERRVEGAVREVDTGLARRLDAGEVVTYRVPLDAEHRYESGRADQLVEIFIGFDEAGGRPMRLELYVPVDIADTVRHVTTGLVPLVLAGLLLFAVITLPLSISLGRRMDRDARRRQELLHYGLAASDQERRDLAQRLHDGVTQDLASVGLLLDSALAREPGPGVLPAGRPELERSRQLIASDVQQLRSLLTDLAPAGSIENDVEAALHRLIDQVRSGPAHVTVVADPDLGLSDRTAVLLYRTTRELLLNAFRHSAATRIDIRLLASGHRVEATVSDNGSGFDMSIDRAEGHIGLALVEQSVTESGGTFELRSAPEDGTTATVTVPRITG